MKATTLQLVTLFSHGQADLGMADRFYHEAVFELGRHEVLTGASLVPMMAGAARYTYPDEAVRLLHVLYDDTDLASASLQELAADDPDWRTRSGPPVAYTEEQEFARTFRLVPAPDRPSGDFSFMTGTPMGHDFPSGAAVVLHTETREDAPDWMDLPLALGLLAREYERETPYRDPTFAAACRQVASIIWTMVL